ncbi:MAG: hypothetical protein AAB113_12395 [Candidatus Eisenbacteria bacterium]
MRFEARCFDDLLRRNETRRRMLVIGCGPGVEVNHLAEVTGVPVMGVDLDVDPRDRRPGVQLLRADARGLAYFGTPAKSRLVGGVGGRARAWEKVVWNLVDWWKRVRGQWENRRGARAGFTDRELAGLLGQQFGRVESVSLPYDLGKYPGLAGFWRTSFRLGLHRFLAPSVYFSAAGEASGQAAGR